MKIVIRRHVHGYYIVPEIINLGAAELARLMPVPDVKTSYEEMLSAGLSDTVRVMIDRAFLDVEVDQGEEIIRCIGRSKCSTKLPSC